MVPSRCNNDPKLGIWTSTQRKLNSNRVDLLESKDTILNHIVIELYADIKDTGI